MRGGGYYRTQAHKALTEIGVAAKPGGYGPDSGAVSLDYLYRPATHLTWGRERGWALSIELPGPNQTYRDIPIGPPDMTAGKAARACAKLLTRQAQLQAEAVKAAVRQALGEGAEKRLGWEKAADLRQLIFMAQDADVLADEPVEDGESNG